MNVRKHSALGYGDPLHQLVQLLIVPDCQLDVTGYDSLLLVVAVKLEARRGSELANKSERRT